LRNLDQVVPPRPSAYGSLISHLQDTTPREFAPMNINWGLFPDPEPPVRDKQVKRDWKLSEARRGFEQWAPELNRFEVMIPNGSTG